MDSPRNWLLLLNLLACTLALASAGDIVHQDDVAPRKPGCENNFVLVRRPTSIRFIFVFVCRLSSAFLGPVLVWLLRKQRGKVEESEFCNFYFLLFWFLKRLREFEVDELLCFVVLSEWLKQCAGEWWKKFRFYGLITLPILALAKQGLVLLFDYLLFKLLKVEGTFAPNVFGFCFWTLIEACVLHLFPFWAKVWFVDYHQYSSLHGVSFLVSLNAQVISILMQLAESFFLWWFFYCLNFRNSAS